MELGKKLGEMAYDGLITNLTPPVQVFGGTICKLSAEATYPRGTLLAKSTKDGKLYILGTTAASGDTLTPDCILCDETVVSTAEDVPAAVYTAGCFDPEKVTVAEEYTLTEADKDKLRERGIVYKAASPAN